MISTHSSKISTRGIINTQLVHSHSYSHEIFLLLCRRHGPLDHKHYARTKSRRVVDTFNVLTRRQTSRPDDQLLVLGLLLDIDVEHLMTLSDEDRWKEFYLSMRE